MNLSSVKSAASYLQTANKVTKPAKKFATAVNETKDGINISAESREVAEHVDEQFDDHTEAVEEAKNVVRNAFDEVSERVTDEGGEVDDGIVEDSIEAVVEGVEHLANSAVLNTAGDVVEHTTDVVHDTLREIVKTGTGAVHGAARAVNAADGVTPTGMPDVDDSAEVAERIVEGVEEAAEHCAEHVGKEAMEWVGEIALEEAAESVAELVPGVGAIIPFWHVVNGTAKATAGACGLVAGSSLALVGGAYGAVAAPFDGGAAWGNVMNASKAPSAWGVSMGAEGGLVATKGALGFANQVPGAQVATIPLKIACSMGASSISSSRNSSREVDAETGDDYEGAITEEMMQVGKTYQIFSADGKRLLRASKTKSNRGFEILGGYHYGGFSLTFDSPSSAESAEDEDERASSFSFSGYPGAYRLHSGMHEGNAMFFLGIFYPADWVVWDVGGKTTGDWEKLELKWQDGAKKFTILGYGGQHVKWRQSEGRFKGSRVESKATKFVLKERNSSIVDIAFEPACGRMDDSEMDNDYEGAITKEMMQVGKTYQLFSADGKRLLRASKTKSNRGFEILGGYHYGGYSLTFDSPSSAESAEDEDERASSFSFSGCPGTYRLHSGMHEDNTMFFLGAAYPRDWVVWDVGGKTTGDWEKLELKWQEGGKTFTILGHGRQHVKWRQSEGLFKGSQTESKATKFVLKERNSSSS